MTPNTPAVLRYRMGVFALALGYTIYQILSSNWTSPGGPMRYLTNWALLASCVSAGAMLLFSAGRLPRPALTLASVTAVLNMIVVLQYWRLYLQDPANVNGNGPIVWWLEYYVHLLGPMLQWIDALFLAGAFRAHRKAIPALCLLVLTYILWAELFVGPLNSKPVGSVTSGLPYPFLNNMELNSRVVFYAFNFVAALSLYALFVGIRVGLDRIHRSIVP